MVDSSWENMEFFLCLDVICLCSSSAFCSWILPLKCVSLLYCEDDTWNLGPSLLHLGRCFVFSSIVLLFHVFHLGLYLFNGLMEQIILYHSSSLRFLKYNFGDVWKIPYSHTIYIKLRYWMLLKRFWHKPTFSEFSFSTSWSMSHCIVLKRLILKICNCRCCVELWRWEIEKKV